MITRKNILKGSVIALILGLAVAWLTLTDTGASVMVAIHALRGFLTLAAAIAFLLTALVVEWNTILRYRGIETVSLGDIERYHPRLPSRTEIGIAMIFTVVFALLFFQFVTIVYAMAFTLSSSSTETNDTRDVVMADFDNDGDLDYIAGNTDAGAPAQNLDVYSNIGSNNFTHMGSITGVSTMFTKFTAADIDGDGDVDLVYGKGTPSYEVGVKKNNGNFSFSSGYSHNYVTETINVYEPIVADLDSDGDADILVYTAVPLRNTLHLNDGHGNFTLTPSPLPAADRAVAADFDSDGDLDLALSYSTNSIKFYKNSGTGAFVQMQNFSGLSGPPTVLVPGDFDGDGDIDLLVPDNSTPAYVNFVVNNGAGQFTQDSAFNVYNYGVTDFASADFDNDGDIDFIDVADDNSVPANGNELWLNNGLGIFSSGWQAAGGDDTSSSLAVGDIDDDGDLDYVLGRSGATADDRFINDQAATVANTAPTAPSGFSVSMTPESTSTISGAGGGSNGTETGSIAWSSMNNALSSDDSYANASLTNADRISNYFKFTNLGFSIPSNATILGVKIDVERNNPSAETVVDQSVRLVVGGSVVGSEKANATSDWGGVDAVATYGGSSDLWSTTLTPANINASNFGLAFAARYVPLLAIGAAARIDQVRVTVYYATANTVRLNWGSGSDTQTPTKLLQYQVRVGTGTTAHNIVSGKAASPKWVSRLMPNGQSRTMILKSLECGLTYFWSVATVDTGFKTTWASEQQFTIDSSCGSPSGSSPPPPSVGGGLPASYFRTNRPDTGSSPGMGLITVTAFKDIDGDGRRSAKELAAFKGLSFTASGRTVEDMPIHRTIAANDKGQAVFDLAPSDDRGYWILTDTGSAVIEGYEPTGLTASGGYILRTGQKISVDFGFLRSDLLLYKPCLAIGTPSLTETKGADAEVLLQRLEDAFGQKAVRGVDMRDELITRKEFFTLLSRTQCVPLIRDLTSLQENVSVNAGNLGITLPLIDIPLDVAKPDSLLIYSMIAAGIDVDRETLIGSAADLSSPITREEAIQAIESVLDIPKARRVTEGGILPNDLERTHPLVPDFLTLQSLGVLPESFLPILGASSGIDNHETALFIVRAAFRGGKINLLPSTFQPKKGAASTPTFLSVLPPLKHKVCLEKDTERSSSIGFTDVLPGDPIFESLRDLLSRGTKNSAKQMLWLLTATRRPTEFGITRGQTKIALEEPVSILETIRSLLVLACLPPDTALDVMSGKDKAGSRQGSGESRVARDRISGLPRDASFPSRIFYRAQDHQKEFDLSLFTYLPEFLRTEERSPGTGLSVIEASRLLASGLLMIEVKNKSLSPLQAENAMEELSAAIRKDLTGKDTDWRDESTLKTVPFTRGMLIQFLSTVVTGTRTKPVITPPSLLPLGEIWWERIK